MDKNEFKNFKPQDDSIEKHEKLILKYAAETIASERHPLENQDSTLVSEVYKTFGIFDGMGGEPAPVLASQTARDYILSRLNEINEGTDIKNAKQILSEIILKTDDAMILASKVNPKSEHMATTASMIKFHTDSEGKNYAMIANVGDSRVYKINKEGILQQMTVDDGIIATHVSDINERKIIEEKLSNVRKESDFDKKYQKFFFMNRSKVSKSLGNKEFKSVNIDVVAIEKGDRFLVTSDGIHDNLTFDEMQEIVKQFSTIEEIVKNLKEKSLERSREDKKLEMRAKPDDMSAVLVEVQ